MTGGYSSLTFAYEHSAMAASMLRMHALAVLSMHCSDMWHVRITSLQAEFNSKGRLLRLPVTKLVAH